MGLRMGMAFDPNAPQSSLRPMRRGSVGRLCQPAREAESLGRAHEPPLFRPKLSQFSVRVSRESSGSHHSAFSSFCLPHFFQDSIIPPSGFAGPVMVPPA